MMELKNKLGLCGGNELQGFIVAVTYCILLSRRRLGYLCPYLLLCHVETDKGDVPIRKEYFQLWYMQGTPYALYDNYAYVTL